MKKKNKLIKTCALEIKIKSSSIRHNYISYRAYPKTLFNPLFPTTCAPILALISVLG